MLELSPGGRFTVACGADAAYGVDVDAGVVARMPVPIDCYATSFDASGTKLVVDGGVIDFAHATPNVAWPALLRLAAAAHEEVDGRTTPPRGTDTSGLYCRFGEVLAPFGVCRDPG
jgi:hypothetical protein